MTTQISRRTALRAAAGTVALGAAGSAGAQETGTPTGTTRPDWGGWLDGVDGGYLDARGQDEVTVRVGADGNTGAFAFAPAGLWVDPGTEVTWQWTGDGGGHNVVTEEGPASLDSGDPIAEAGYTYSHTFEETGITTYFCEPHRSLGMKGGVAVGDDVPTVSVEPPSTGEEGPGFWASLGGGESVLLLLYAMAGVAALSVFGAEWAVDVAHWRERVAAASGIERTTEAAVEEPGEELAHDEYDPWGTATLIAVYFAILVLMWVFMYFVEFLGNGPTIVG